MSLTNRILFLVRDANGNEVAVYGVKPGAITTEARFLVHRAAHGWYWADAALFYPLDCRFDLPDWESTEDVSGSCFRWWTDMFDPDDGELGQVLEEWGDIPSDTHPSYDPMVSAEYRQRAVAALRCAWETVCRGGDLGPNHQEAAAHASLDERCTHPARNGHHEVYLLNGDLVCRACGAWGPLTEERFEKYRRTD
jgi:hypothetical protein